MVDVIVEEVRRVREDHAAQFHFDLDAIAADLKRAETERDWPLRSFAPRRIAKRIPPTDILPRPKP